MSIDYDFDKISLLFEERRCLNKLKRKGSLKKSEIIHFDVLYLAGLVDFDLSDDKDPVGNPIRLNTVHVTDKYRRYDSWLFNRMLRSVFLPIGISGATTLLIIGCKT